MFPGKSPDRALIVLKKNVFVRRLQAQYFQTLYLNWCAVIVCGDMFMTEQLSIIRGLKTMLNEAERMCVQEMY